MSPLLNIQKQLLGFFILSSTLSGHTHTITLFQDSIEMNHLFNLLEEVGCQMVG
jgi:hypothetical protein